MSLQVNNFFSSSQFTSIAIGVIAANHVIGLLGLNYAPTRNLFEHISWINLLLTTVLMLLADKEKSTRLWLFTAIVFLLGMGVEILGVKTGLVFGSYHYTPVLGLQLFAVPLIIGVNWVLLTYATGVLVNKWLQNFWQKVFAGAILMVLIDVLLEFFAIRHHLWVWPQTGYPLAQNFIGWFVTGLIAHAVFQKTLPQAQNSIGKAYIPILTAFALADFILGKLLVGN